MFYNALKKSTLYVYVLRPLHLLAEGKVIRIDKEYFANDPSRSVEQLIDAEAARLDAYLRSVPDALTCSSCFGSSMVSGAQTQSWSIEPLGVRTRHLYSLDEKNSLASGTNQYHRLATLGTK
jgi:hypothetical protein